MKITPVRACLLAFCTLPGLADAANQPPPQTPVVTPSGVPAVTVASSYS